MTAPIREPAVSTHFFALPRALDPDRFADWLADARHALDEAEAVERSRHPDRAYGARRECLCAEDGHAWLCREVEYQHASDALARAGADEPGGPVAASALPRRDGAAGAICRAAWPDVNGNPVFVDGRMV